VTIGCITKIEFLGDAEILFLQHHVQTNSGAQRAFYPINTEEFFPGSTAVDCSPHLILWLNMHGILPPLFIEAFTV
jgi:hypothetical protein